MINPWKMLSDRHIKELFLSEELDNDTIRLIFITMFYRIKHLEEQNFALNCALMAEGIVNEEQLKSLLAQSREHLSAKDKKKFAEAELWKSYGISFKELVKFSLKGSFQDDD